MLLQGHIDQTQLLNYARTSSFWLVLIKKDVYADPEVQIRDRPLMNWRQNILLNLQNRDNSLLAYFRPFLVLSSNLSNF